eukprot:CAMPEP_0194491882 /NCGR_PEP_ID=MMETSP0253-20130528/10635_1 /TAXON_ID=2966 /ORGANISM="Noctiluca scintillans" /LENGTH=38 /DNA_ID= /DNA_START= /DNA_END= /DNA_ORIENTATION=
MSPSPMRDLNCAKQEGQTSMDGAGTAGQSLKRPCVASS